MRTQDRSVFGGREGQAMIVGLRALLIVVAVVLFVLGAIGVPSGRYSLISAGLAFLSSSMLVP